MEKVTIKELGEYIPNTLNSVTLNKLKEFVIVPYFIKWYKTKESNKIFPIFLQELSDLNPTKIQIPGILTRNPFFDHTQIKYFSAYKNGVPAGRIMAFIDYNYNKNKEKTGWLGLFESIEDKMVAKKLLDAAIKYLNDNLCSRAIGPSKFNANGEIGLLINGFSKKPYFMEPYNAPYYQDYFEKYGFTKENDWFSMNTDESLSSMYIQRIDSLMQRINQTRRGNLLNEFKIRQINFKDTKNEIKLIKNLYNHIWGIGNHPQYVEMTKEEFETLAIGIKTIALEDLIFIVEKDKTPIGVSISLPNINEIIEEYDENNPYMPSKRFFSLKDLRRDIRIFNIIQKRLKQKRFSGIRILILGVHKKFRKTGIDSKLYHETAKAAKAIGITHASGSELADINNDILNPMLKIGKIALTWRFYKLNI